MTQKIGMNVSAQFDASAVNQGIQQINQAINQVNQHPINPVSPQAGRQLDALNQKFQQLLKVDAELRRRIKATGQEGKLFEQIDWGATHPNQASRERKLNGINDYLAGGNGSGGGNRPPTHPNNNPSPRNNGGMSQVVVGAAQAGLRATGPAGGVAANAIGTGMSAGMGAGLMGLIGGIVALGVGKVIGGIMEKVGQAEDNSVAFDKLKRTIGDVNVSFDGLQKVMQGGANNAKVTFSEFTQLSSQFTKSGNLKSKDYTSLAAEVGDGVGMSRSFGLDPSQGVGVMGQMRGVGVTKSLQDSRRFALLIGETIGKSGAFSKADEVMEAIGSYAQTQTRATLGNANVSGYAGMYSSMVGSGIAGLDPSGVSSILSRLNASMTQGGAKGEASQFFTSKIGQKNGMDVFDTQLWREGGAFSTANSTFGDKSSVGKYYEKFGLAKPKGDQSFLSSTLEQLRKDYGKDPKMLLQATANHTGLSMSQASSLHLLKPNQMGEMEKYAGDLSKVNMEGLGNLSKVVTGTDEDRQSVAENLKQRQLLKGDDESKYNAALKSGDVDTQKEILGRLVASNDQERTTGTDIRDSKNSLDNIKTSLADKLVPLTIAMRQGIINIAGKGKKSTSEILKEVVEVDSKSRVKGIESKSEIAQQQLRYKIYSNRNKLSNEFSEDSIMANYGRDPKKYKQKMAERNALIEESEDLNRQIKSLDDKKVDLLKKEKARKDAELAGVDTAADAQWKMEASESSIKASSNGKLNVKGYDTSSVDDSLAAAEKKVGLPAGTMKSIMTQEGDKSYLDNPSKYHYPIGADGKRRAPNGKISTAFGPFGILESTAADPGFGVSPLKNKGMDEQIRFSSEYAAAMSKEKGGLEKGLAAYGEGSKYSKEVMSRIGAGTKMPNGASGSSDSGGKFSISAEPIVVLHKNEKGGEYRPPDKLQTKVSAAASFGRDR